MSKYAEFSKACEIVRQSYRIARTFNRRMILMSRLRVSKRIISRRSSGFVSCLTGQPILCRIKSHVLVGFVSSVAKKSMSFSFFFPSFTLFFSESLIKTRQPSRRYVFFVFLLRASTVGLNFCCSRRHSTGTAICGNYFFVCAGSLGLISTAPFPIHNMYSGVVEGQACAALARVISRMAAYSAPVFHFGDPER